MYMIYDIQINMLTIKKYCKARNHCHNVGEYRGAAHCTCNFKYSEPGEITIVFLQWIKPRLPFYHK